MIRMNRPRTIAYLLLLAAAIVWASFQGGVLPYMCLFSVLCYPLITIIYMLLSFLILEIYQELPEHRVLKLEEQPYRLSFQNAGFLRINDMDLELEAERSETALSIEGFESDQVFHGENGRVRVRLLPGERLDITGTCVCRFAGAYDIGLTGVFFRDPFGIFEMRRNAPSAFRVTVMPRVTDLAAEAVDFENLRNSSRLKSRRQYEPIPSNIIRPYQAGDTLNRIHWKVSAAAGELLVRIPEELDTRELYLVMEADNAPREKRDMGYTIRRDFFLEFAVSAAWYFAEKGEELRILYPRGSMKTALVASSESFLEFYEDVSKGPFYNKDEVQQEMLRAAERLMEQDENRVVITITEAAYPGEDFFRVRSRS